MQLITRIARLCKVANEKGYISLAKEPLQAWWKRFCDEPWRVLVIGEYNAGKSELINALLGENITKVGPIPTTQEFTWYKVAEGLEVVDSPGFNDPALDEDKRNAFIKSVQEHQKTADLLLLVVSSQAAEQADIYAQVLKVLESKRLLVVINIKDQYHDAEKEQLVEAVRAKFLPLISQGQLVGVLVVNAESALRAKTNGRLNLLRESGIEALEKVLRTEEQEFRAKRNEADKILLKGIVDAVKEKARNDIKAMALLAEARVLYRLLKEGRSVFVHPETLLSAKEIDALKEILQTEYVIEIRPIGEKTYLELLEMPEDDRPIIRKLPYLKFSVDEPVCAIVGVEMQGCSITREGGDLFVLASDLRKCTIEARDRADVWLGKVRLGENPGNNAVSLERRSCLVGIDIVMSGFGGLCKGDGTSEIDLRNVQRSEGFVSAQIAIAKSARPVELVSAFRLPSVPDPLEAFGFFHGYVFAGIAKSAVELYEIASGKLTDRFLPPVLANGKPYRFTTVAYILANEKADLLLIRSDASPGFHLGTIRDGKCSSPVAVKSPWRVPWYNMDQSFSLGRVLISDDGALWACNDKQVFMYQLRAFAETNIPKFAASPPLQEKVSLTALAFASNGEIYATTRGEGFWAWQLLHIGRDKSEVLASGQNFDGERLLVSPDGKQALLRLRYEDNKTKHVTHKYLAVNLCGGPVTPQGVPIPETGPSFVSWLPGGETIAAITQEAVPRLVMLSRDDSGKWQVKQEVYLEYLSNPKACYWTDRGRVALVDGNGVVVVLDVKPPEA